MLLTFLLLLFLLWGWGPLLFAPHMRCAAEPKCTAVLHVYHQVLLAFSGAVERFTYFS